MTSFTSVTGAPFWSGYSPVDYDTSQSIVSRALSSVKDKVLEISEGQLVLDDDTPRWVARALNEIHTLEQLPSDWDSYGSRPLSRSHARTALAFLSHVMSENTMPPDIVPLADGGIQLEWRVDGLEIDFISDEESPVPGLFVTTGDELCEYFGALAVQHFNSYLRVLLADSDRPTLV